MCQACGSTSEHQPLGNREQMIQGALAITQLPVLVTFIDFIEQLRRAYRQQHLPQYRNDKGRKPQQIQPG
ncbi:hypothetical protein D3C81_1546140 [compost metagenome]